MELVVYLCQDAVLVEAPVLEAIDIVKELGFNWNAIGGIGNFAVGLATGNYLRSGDVVRTTIAGLAGTRGSADGTGSAAHLAQLLGLPVVLGIVEAHGGTITVDSQPGRGTTFTLVFPATDEPAPTESQRAVVEKFSGIAKEHSVLDFFLNIVPDNVVGAFVHADVLQIMFFAVLFGAAVLAMGEKGRKIEETIDRLSAALARQ